MENKKPALKIKLAILAGSFLFFVLLLESVLRVIGHFYVLRTSAPVPKNRSGYYVILCVGDSFTFAGNVRFKKAYPFQLGKLLGKKHPEHKFLVINKGVCEANSRQVLNSLPKWIKVYKPNLVISLVGSADRFNILNYNLNSAQQDNTLSALKEAIYSLKVFKMARIIYLNLKWKTLYYCHAKYLTAVGPAWARYVQGRDYFRRMERVTAVSQKDPFSKIWFYHNKGDDQSALKAGRELINGSYEPARAICAAAYIHYKKGNYQTAERYFKEALNKTPHSDTVLCQAIFFYRGMAGEYMKKGRNDLAVGYYLKEIELDPTAFSPYYLLCKAYELQSTYDSDSVIMNFRRMIANNKGLGNNKLFMEYFNLFQDKRNWERDISNLLKNELENMVAICRNNKIELIMQNYPVSYPMANKVCREIADKYSLPFVDNLVFFNELLNTHSRQDYIFDDGHCTALGYGVMAENIYRILIQEGIILGK